MKLNKAPRISGDPTLQRELSEHANLVNLITDGRLSGTNNATTAAPSGGDYARGDFVKNSEPSELGAVSSKYVVLGWICTVAGPPGTFVQVRALTGN